MISISVAWVIGAGAYILISTGLLIAVIAGASKDIADTRMNNATLRESLFEQAKAAVQNGKEKEENKQQQLTLLKKYVDIQNEYAWFRCILRSAEPEMCAQVEKLVKDGGHIGAPTSRLASDYEGASQPQKGHQ